MKKTYEIKNDDLSVALTDLERQVCQDIKNIGWVNTDISISLRSVRIQSHGFDEKIFTGNRVYIFDVFIINENNQGLEMKKSNINIIELKGYNPDPHGLYGIGWFYRVIWNDSPVTSAWTGCYKSKPLAIAAAKRHCSVNRIGTIEITFNPGDIK